MKREGRQHGMVRCHQILPQPLNPRPESRYLNWFDSPPTAGLFTRVSTKPTNHSKFTGKCGRPRCKGCHESPVHKSKDKMKGMQKLRLVMWRVADAELGSKLSGFSATELLDQMDGENVTEAYEMSCEIGSLAVDIRDHDEDKSENKGCDDDESHEICDEEFVWDDWVDYEDGDWCFVDATL